MRIAIVGGTGGLGYGLAVRLAAAGCSAASAAGSSLLEGGGSPPTK